MKTHHSMIVPCGLALTAIGLFIRYQIGRRRFNRRGIGGLQRFDSYGVGLLTTAIERLVNFIGAFMLWAGIFLLCITGFNHIKF